MLDKGKKLRNSRLKGLFIIDTGMPKEQVGALGQLCDLSLSN